METDYKKILHQAYSAFNARDIEGVLKLMHPKVLWPNAWEGGYISGHDAIRPYWERQWKEINPKVEPMKIIETGNGNVEVMVRQIIKDSGGNLLFDGIIKHVYTFEESLIKKMEIREA